MRWLLPLICVACSAQEKQWDYSASFFVGANALDAYSSRGLIETNPILGRGQFGARQELIKVALTGAILLTERLVMRKHRATAKPIIVINYLSGGLLLITANDNFKIRRLEGK